MRVAVVVRAEDLFILSVGYPGSYYRTYTAKTFRDLGNILSEQACSVRNLELVLKGAGPFVLDEEDGQAV